MRNNHQIFHLFYITILLSHLRKQWMRLTNPLQRADVKQVLNNAFERMTSYQNIRITHCQDYCNKWESWGNYELFLWTWTLFFTTPISTEWSWHSADAIQRGLKDVNYQYSSAIPITSGNVLNSFGRNANQWTTTFQCFEEPIANCGTSLYWLSRHKHTAIHNHKVYWENEITHELGWPGLWLKYEIENCLN